MASLKLQRLRRPAPLLLLCPCLLLALLAPARCARVRAAQDDEVVRVNSELVVLNVTATDKRGAYVHGLKQADFKIFEDGREQTITGFSEEPTPFAAALLLDISGSMEGRVTLARSAAIRFLDGLRPDDSVAVYSFHTEVKQVQDYGYTRDLDPLVFGLDARGMTVLNDAVVRAARDLGARPEKRRAIVVLSDGADTRSSASGDKALDAALAANATIYTVDLSDRNAVSAGTLTGAGALKQFASRSGGRYLATPGGQELREAFAAVVEELSNQYTITYRPTNRVRDGRYRTIEVKLARPDTVARTRRGYRAPKG
ncbi:MAG TPA: VWA domain-containing protein [Pyrinomonadaceae bacterium]|jgi:Ca-activated chloride channel family protein